MKIQFNEDELKRIVAEYVNQQLKLAGSWKVEFETSYSTVRAATVSTIDKAKDGEENV